jgi:hypothetical protein
MPENTHIAAHFVLRERLEFLHASILTFTSILTPQQHTPIIGPLAYLALAVGIQQFGHKQ